jgi:thiamine pyrophosphokinase
MMPSSQVALVVCNGEYSPPVCLEELRRLDPLVVAADGGLANALRMGLEPHALVGDLDSLTDDLRGWAQKRQLVSIPHPADKDETDAELALSYALAHVQGPAVILCALGGRIDHALANIFLLAMPGARGRAYLASGPVEIHLVERELVLSGQPGDLLSLLPFGSDAQGIWAEGVRWQLRGETLRLGFARGVSNIFTAERVRIRLESGLLLAIHTRQRAKGAP